MKQLLETDFVKSTNSSACNHKVVGQSFSGKAVFYDNRACDQCSINNEDGCNKQVFNVESSGDVEVVDIENFLNGFKKLRESKCDLVMYDNAKIAFVDMYCGQSKYVERYIAGGVEKEGKQDKVKRQIENTIKLLCNVPSINEFIGSLDNKIAIFACRLKDNQNANLPEKIKQTQESFMSAMNIHKNRQIITPLSNGFSYLRVEYPNTYKW